MRCLSADIFQPTKYISIGKHDFPTTPRAVASADEIKDFVLRLATPVCFEFDDLAIELCGPPDFDTLRLSGCIRVADVIDTFLAKWGHSRFRVLDVNVWKSNVHRADALRHLLTTDAVLPHLDTLICRRQAWGQHFDRALARRVRFAWYDEDFSCAAELHCRDPPLDAGVDAFALFLLTRDDPRRHVRFPHLEVFGTTMSITRGGDFPKLFHKAHARNAPKLETLILQISSKERTVELVRASAKLLVDELLVERSANLYPNLKRVIFAVGHNEGRFGFEINKDPTILSFFTAVARVRPELQIIWDSKDSGGNAERARELVLEQRALVLASKQ